jgi:hypothetical protein
MAQAAVQLIAGQLVPSLEYVEKEELYAMAESHGEKIALSSLPFFVGFHAGIYSCLCSALFLSFVFCSCLQ